MSFITFLYDVIFSVYGETRVWLYLVICSNAHVLWCVWCKTPALLCRVFYWLVTNPLPHYRLPLNFFSGFSIRNMHNSDAVWVLSCSCSASSPLLWPEFYQYQAIFEQHVWVFISPYPNLQHLHHEKFSSTDANMQTQAHTHTCTRTHWAAETYMFSVLNSFRKTQRTVSNFLPFKACIVKSNAMSLSTALSTAVYKSVFFRVPHNPLWYDMSNIHLSKWAQLLLETWHEHMLAFTRWQMSPLLYTICLDLWEYLPKAVTGYRKQQSPMLWDL